MTARGRTFFVCRSLAAVLLVAPALAGCATSQEELLPAGDTTMMEIWEKHARHSNRERRLLDARSELRRPLETPDLVAEQLRYSRTARHAIHSRFRRLPNPDLVMYVYPHLAGSASVPVPGYATVFPLHSRPQYAMPGETARPQPLAGGPR